MSWDRRNKLGASLIEVFVWLALAVFALLGLMSVFGVSIAGLFD